MTKLGDFLEAVHGPSRGFRTLRASIVHRRNRPVAEEARRHRYQFGKSKATIETDETLEEIVHSVWIAVPDRVRIESRGEKTHCQLAIINDEVSWARDNQGHVEVSRDYRVSPGATCAERHFSHAMLRDFFKELDLEAVGEVQTAGHDCLRLRARLKPDGRLWPHWLPPGADEYELHAEPTRGVVLSILAKFKGEVFETIEVTEAVFDEPLDEELFRYEPSLGEQVRPATPIVELLTLAEAIQRVSFMVLVPEHRRKPETVTYHPARPASSRAYLTLMYHQHAERLWLDESATPEPDRDNLEWEQVNRAGCQLRISDPGVDGGTRLVMLKQFGTYVTIHSGLAREPLLDLAASLVPATA